jgi:hypothetical protein
MNDAVRLAVGLINKQQLECIIEGASFGALAFEQAGGVADDFRRVTEEEKPLVVELAQGELGFPAERRRLVIRDVEIIAGTPVTLFSRAPSVKSDADVVLDDYILAGADDFRPFKERADRLPGTEDQVADGAGFELERNRSRAGEAAGDKKRFERSAEEQQQGMRMNEMIEEPDHLFVLAALFIRRERLWITRRYATDAAKFRTLAKRLCLPVRGNKHLLKADRHVTSRFRTDADHFPDFSGTARRGFLNPNMGARPHAVHGKSRKNREVLGVVAGNDKNQLGIFRLEHLMVIGVDPGCAEKAGTTRCPLRVEIADRRQIHRRKGKRRIDVPECMAAGADETDTQFPGVLVIVSNVQDKKTLLNYSPTTCRSAELKTIKRSASDWPMLVARCQTFGGTVTVSPGFISDSVPSAMVWRMFP